MANKSLNLHNLTKKFLLRFITQSYLKIDHNSKQIDFLVNYTNTKAKIMNGSKLMISSVQQILQKLPYTQDFS